MPVFFGRPAQVLRRLARTPLRVMLFCACRRKQFGGPRSPIGQSNQAGKLQQGRDVA